MTETTIIAVEAINIDTLALAGSVSTDQQVKPFASFAVCADIAVIINKKEMLDNKSFMVNRSLANYL